MGLLNYRAAPGRGTDPAGAIWGACLFQWTVRLNREGVRQTAKMLGYRSLSAGF